MMKTRLVDMEPMIDGLDLIAMSNEEEWLNEDQVQNLVTMRRNGLLPLLRLNMVCIVGIFITKMMVES